MLNEQPESDLDLAHALLWKTEHNVEAACQAVHARYPRSGGGVGIANSKRANELCRIVRKMAGERSHAYREAWAR